MTNNDFLEIIFLNISVVVIVSFAKYIKQNSNG